MLRKPPRRPGATWALGVVVTLALAGCGDGADPATDGTAGLSTESLTDAVEPADDAPGADDPGAGDPRDADAPVEAGDGTAAVETGEEPVLTLVATSAPITDLVARVGGERVRVTSMVPPGADAHTYEPRPQDVVDLSEADAFLGVGLALNDGAERLAAQNLRDGAPVVLLGEALVDDELVFDHGHTHDGDADHGHSHDHDGDADHSHGDDLGPNPHVWTSVTNAMGIVDAIALALTDLDPAGAASYTDNAQQLGEALDELHRATQQAAGTIPAANRTLVTYHDAWTYFARDHDLAFATAIQPADDAEPSANEVRALIDLIRELGVPVVFGSEEFPTPVLETIAEETDARYLANLADDVLPGSPGEPEHSYLEMMRRNAVSIIGGLGGDVSRLERLER